MIQNLMLPIINLLKYIYHYLHYAICLHIRSNIYRLNVRCLHLRLICMNWLSVAINSTLYFSTNHNFNNGFYQIIFSEHLYLILQIVVFYPPSMYNISLALMLTYHICYICNMIDWGSIKIPNIWIVQEFIQLL